MREAHQVYGLTVASDVDLHLGHTAPVADPDVWFRVGEPIDDMDETPAGQQVLRHELTEDAHATFVRRPDGSHLLRYAHAADFVVSPDLSEVTIHAVRGTDAEFCSVLAAGGVLAFLLMLRGHLVLHASAVQLGSSAMAFVGYSGMGKSTMAALVCGEGGSLITDDVLRVDVEGDLARCRLGASELRLRKSAAELADRFADAPGRRVTTDRRDALRPQGSVTDGLPLAAVVVPRPRRDVERVDAVRLRGLEALMTLVRYPRLVGIVDPELHAHQLAALGDLVERVPVFEADVPWGPPFQPGIAAELLRGIGLAGLIHSSSNDAR